MSDSVIEQVKQDQTSAADGDPRRLERYGFKIHSQSDEDGIIDEIFRRVGKTSKVFVDFGAETGQENNSRYLLEQGWTGLWIEALPEYASSIRYSHQEVIESGSLKFVEAAVTAENINELIGNSGISGEIDFLSVDIDGNDYHVFDAIDVVKPRVLCLEHNPAYPPPEEWIMPYNPDHRWEAGSTLYGASFSSLEKVANEKGMVLVGCGLYSPNSFFVREDLVGEKFSLLDDSSKFYRPMDYDKIVSFPEGVLPFHPRVKRLEFEMELLRFKKFLKRVCKKVESTALKVKRRLSGSK